MRGVPNPELKAEAIRLRVEGRLSLNAIHRRTGASKGSLSTWLRGYPLTEAERRQAIRIGRVRGAMGGLPKKDRGAESVLHKTVPSSRLSRHQKAKVAEAAVLLRLVLHGFTPFGSVFDGDKTDWLVEAGDGRAWKIQVKWAKSENHGLPVVRLKCRSGHNGERRYHRGEFDFLVGYDLFSDSCFVWSFDELAHLTSAVTISAEARERWDKIKGL